jgi:2-polyprenyl-6-methoxyphenol hydroxylase-like FAD-dependent oxidoreductase
VTAGRPQAGQQPDAIVVGGGIGGLSAAFALTRKGLSVRVLERSAEFGEVGAGMQIAPNCTRILDAYGLLAAAKRLGVLPKHMVMKDAVDGTVLTSLDLTDAMSRYGTPYMVIHRSDLHGLFLEACREAGVDLRTSQPVTSYENTAEGARVTLEDGAVHEAPLVIAADGLHSAARAQFVGDEPVNSAFVAYRGAVPIERVRENGISETDVVVYIGPGCHFVQYPLRGGEMFNQVAVFESPRARAGEADWGTPDELDAAYAGMTSNIQRGLPLMAIEDGYVLAEHLAANPADTAAALAAYQAVRPEHCRRVVLTSRAWGKLWHLDGEKRDRRNAILRARETTDYSFVDWLYSITALTPAEEPAMFETISLDPLNAR